MRKNMHKPPKRSDFAIRKLTIGAAAVLLVGPLISASTQNVHASENTTTQIKQVETSRRNIILKAATVVGIIPAPETIVTNLPQGATVTWVREPKVSEKGTASGRIRIKGQSASGIPFAYDQWVAVTVYAKNEWYDPKVQDLTTEVGQAIDVSKTVTNLADLPEGTMITWRKEPDVSKAGLTTGTVLVTYPDNSNDEEEVKVQVNEGSKEPTDADRFTPEFQDLETTVGQKLHAADAVKNKDQDWRIMWHNAPDFEKAGVYEVVVKVFYKDGSHDEGTIKVTVKEAVQPEDELEEITDHTKHTDLVKKVTRTIHVHHPAGDKEPVWQTALFTRTKFFNKNTGLVHHYTDWQAQKDTWEEFVP